MLRLRPTICQIFLPSLALLGGCAVVPQPFSAVEITGQAQARLEAVAVSIPGKVVSVSLYEAIARALKYNFDNHVESYQVALRAVETRAVVAQGLPALVANAGYAARSNDLSKGSLELDPPPPPLTALSQADSVSTEREVGASDLALTWNLLDLALSYTRAEQAADRVLIAQEQRRRIAQRIIEDTRAAYWRAQSHERLIKRLAVLDDRAAKAIKRTRLAAREGAETPMTALSYERELTQIRQTAEKLRHELSLAKAQLAALMNLPPGVSFDLVNMVEAPDPSVAGMSVAAMISEAIYNRPEIRELAYQVRISEAEVRAAFFEVLPAIRLNASLNFSDDHFLFNENWVAAGVAAAGNLLKVVQLPARRAAIEADREVLQAKALATTLAIITQVHIGRIRYSHSHILLETAREYLAVQQKLVNHLREEKAADLIGEQTLIREEMNLVVGEVQADIAVANVLGAGASMMTTLGYDLQGRDLDLSQDVSAIARQIKTHWSNRSAISDRGRFLAEVEKARLEAKRRAEAEAKRRLEEAARERAEKARIAKLAVDEAHKARRAEAARLLSETQKRRAEVAKKRRPSISKAPAVVAQEKEKFWPFEDSPPVPPTPSKHRPPKIYSGTK